MPGWHLQLSIRIKAHYKYRHEYDRGGTVKHENHYLQDGSDDRDSRDTLSSSSYSGKHNLDLEFTLRKNSTKSLYGHIGGMFGVAESTSRDAGINRVDTSTIIRDESVCLIVKNMICMAYSTLRTYLVRI